LLTYALSPVSREVPHLAQSATPERRAIRAPRFAFNERQAASCTARFVIVLERALGDLTLHAAFPDQKVDRQ
jgi:hypothetical protein